MVMKASVNEVAKFLEKAVNDLRNGRKYGTTWHMWLNDLLELDVGYMDGFDEEDYEDGCAICAEICVNDDMPDIEWATMPYNDDDVWDTNMSIESWDFDELAQWYVDQAEEMLPAIESGEYKIPGYEPEDDDYYYESKRVNERQSDRSFIDYKKTDFDNPDTEYAVTVWQNGETYGKTHYFDNFKEAKDFARDMRSRDDVDNVVVRKEIVYGREYDKAEYSTSDWLKYDSDDDEYYTPIGKDAYGEVQFKKYSESKNRGKKKVKESVYSFDKSIEELIDGGYENALNYLRAVYLQDISGEPVFYADESDVSDEELIDYFAGTYFVPEDFVSMAGDDWSKVESKNRGRRNIKKINESKSDWYDDLYFSTTEGRGDFTVGNKQNSFNQSYEFDDPNEEIWVCQHHLKCLQKALQNNHIGYTTEKFSGDNDGDCQICDDGENHSTIYCVSDFYED